MRPGFGIGLLIVLAAFMIGVTYVYSGDGMEFDRDSGEWFQAVVGFEQ